MSTGYSLFVIFGTLGSLLAFALILWLNRHVNNPGKTTGHVYDGIEEYDNPMPAWWFWGFMLSIFYALGYLIYYPGLGNFPGLGGWTQIGQLEEQQEEAEAMYGPVFAQYRDMPIDELAEHQPAMRMGRRLFLNYCSQCHGTAGTGSRGYPNLTDDHWQWGGDAEQIRTTITGGRQASMPPWLGQLREDGIMQVTEYVLQLAGREVEERIANAGRSQYEQYCAACHGPSGTGQVALGAPDLTDNVWLYGGNREAIASVIRDGREGEMPAFERRLGEDRVHVLSAYVRSLTH